MEKLQADGHYSAYNKVFMERLQERIKEYGRPDRHVINDTRIIRPVFDTTAKEFLHQAVNEFLET